MLKIFIAVGLLLLSAAFVGCDSSSSSDSSLQAGLLQRADLPAGTVARKSLDPNTPCSPLPLLRAGAGEVRRTPSFKSGHLYVQESVAYFPDEPSARRTYAALSSRKRAECIASNARFVGRLLEAHLIHGQFGDRERHLILKLKKNHRRIEIRSSSLQQGRAVAVLLLVANPAPLARSEVRRVLTLAAERMKSG